MPPTPPFPCALLPRAFTAFAAFAAFAAFTAFTAPIRVVAHA